MKLSLKKRIMLGIYAMYCLRQLRTPLVAQVFLFILMVLILVSFVSVPSFFANMLASGNFSSYFLMAFSNTSFLIQSIFILVVVTAFFCTRNIARHTVSKQYLA